MLLKLFDFSGLEEGKKAKRQSLDFIATFAVEKELVEQLFCFMLSASCSVVVGGCIDTRTHTHTQNEKCFKDIATADTKSVDTEVVQLICPFCVARIH